MPGGGLMAVPAREGIEGDFTREEKRAESSFLHPGDERVHGGGGTRAALAEQAPEAGVIGNADCLVLSCRQLSSLADRSSMLENSPRLAMGICRARGAQILEVRADRTATAVATHGAPLQLQMEEITDRARGMLDRQEAGPLLAERVQ